MAHLSGELASARSRNSDGAGRRMPGEGGGMAAARRHLSVRVRQVCRENQYDPPPASVTDRRHSAFLSLSSSSRAAFCRSCRRRSGEMTAPAIRSIAPRLSVRERDGGPSPTASPLVALKKNSRPPVGCSILEGFREPVALTVLPERSK